MCRDQGGDSYEVGADVQAHGAAADEADAQGGHAALGGGHVVAFAFDPSKTST